MANVGEQRPNSDAKVFEVHINIEKPDTTLRPGMTTGNAINTFTAKDVIYIPIEAVSTDSGLPVVYVQSGSHVVKQEVETAQMNDDDVIVTRGLKPGDRILMAAPADHDRLAIVHLPGSHNVAPVPNGDTALPVQPAPSKKATPGVKGAPPAPSADSTHHVLSPG